MSNIKIKFPKDDSKYRWTEHVKRKMFYYKISESLIKRVIRAPRRTEHGVAPNTTAVMQSRTRARSLRDKPYGNKKLLRRVNNIEEIWVMYQLLNSKAKRIISAWRYPGVSPRGREIPIPDDIRQELEQALDS